MWRCAGVVQVASGAVYKFALLDEVLYLNLSDQ